MNWHIGCSGYFYREWKAVFYPEGLIQKKWFEYYSSRFDTLELNTTFYRFPQLKFLENWYNTSPAAFTFSVKVPRLITHYKQFSDCNSLLDDFYTTVNNGLKEKLGPVLFQLPPSFSFTEERLEKIINSCRTGFLNTVEFRHESWWKETVYARLRDEKIIYCGISHPKLPDQAVINHAIAYYRFHGVPKLYYSAYDVAFLQKIAGHFRSRKELREVFIYFNNTATMAAIENAVWLKQYIENG
jgi:uncharacterized protein YecE (DUF72 family)